MHDAPVDAKAAENQAAFVPDSTRVMNLSEMIEKVRLSSEIAPSFFNFASSSIFPPSPIAIRFLKPLNLNISIGTTSCVNYRALTDLILAPKKFIARLKSLSIKGICLNIGEGERFNANLHHSQYTTIDIIKQAITILEAGLSITIIICDLLTIIQGRLTNLYDIPRHAPYLFVEPDLTTKEAQSMLDNVPADVYGGLFTVTSLDEGYSNLSPAAIISVVKARLETETEPWDELDILRILLKERDTLGLTTKKFMKSLRYAITGMKVSLCPPMVILIF